MNEPERTEWQIRCTFNGFCKRTLKNESINAHKDLRKRQTHEINFSDLTPKEENQLYTCEDFFAEDKEEQTFFRRWERMGCKDDCRCDPQLAGRKKKSCPALLLL